MEHSQGTDYKLVNSVVKERQPPSSLVLFAHLEQGSTPPPMRDFGNRRFQPAWPYAFWYISARRGFAAEFKALSGAAGAVAHRSSAPWSCADVLGSARARSCGRRHVGVAQRGSGSRPLTARVHSGDDRGPEVVRLPVAGGSGLRGASWTLLPERARTALSVGLRTPPHAGIYLSVQLFTPGCAPGFGGSADGRRRAGLSRNLPPPRCRRGPGRRRCHCAKAPISSRQLAVPRARRRDDFLHRQRVRAAIVRSRRGFRRFCSLVS